MSIGAWVFPIRTSCDRGGPGITPDARRIALAVLATSSLALGYALPARADDATVPPVVPAAPAAPETPAVPETTVSMPTVPDTSDAAAPTDAAASTLGAANLAVSVRINSPGDNGDVTQTIESQAESGVQTAAQGAGTTEAASTGGAATQVAPANVAVSIRVASPGSDGQVTQTIAADTSAQGQYQPPATQYQADAQPATPAAAPDASAAEAPTAAQPATGAADSPSVRSTWIWNWTWTCADITGFDTTQTIDTGITGWIWTWNLDTICAASTASDPPSGAGIPPESGDLISPSAPEVVAPVAPELPQVTPPEPPDPPAVVPPEPPVVVLPEPPVAPPPIPQVGAEVPGLAPEAIARAIPPAATPRIAPFPVAGRARHAAGPLERSRQSAPQEQLPWVAAAAVSTVTATPRMGERDRPATRRRARDTQPLHVLAFPPLPIGGGGDGPPGGGSASGVVAALTAWLLLQLPGLAVLRLPPSRRTPRARVDEIPSRPG